MGALQKDSGQRILYQLYFQDQDANIQVRISVYVV